MAVSLSRIIRTVKQSIWLGWMVQTNWADPVLFAGYYLLRPVTGLLTVGFIFIIGSFASGGVLNPQYFAYMFIGSSFFAYVIEVMSTMTTLIHEDRAHYEVLKHIYLTPTSLSWYIVGRALNGVMNASMSLLMTMGFGVLIFQGLLGIPLPVNWLAIDYPLLAVSLILGVVCFMAIGFVLCGINIMTSKVQFSLIEYVSGILNLFGGVVFVPALLPTWAQTLTSILPITYFLNSVRYAMLHQGPFDAAANLLYLLITMIATITVGYVVFNYAMYRARRDGLLDRKEEY